MPVKQPGRRLLHHVPLKFVHDRVAGGGRKAADASIALVPFIDFLITLVVFLLSSFSATGQLGVPPTIKMPSAQHAVPLEISPVIAVDANVVTLEGNRVADSRALAQSPQVERIEPLVQDLETLKRNWSILHPTTPFPGAVVLQADQHIDFRVIKKVTFSAAQAGYSNISFAVNRKGGG